LCFCKALISHNNISESSVYLNGKQTWKLGNFELALPFAELNKDNLRNIYEFKCSNAITPEEELEAESSTTTTLKNSAVFDLDRILKSNPHAIDAYGWAMLISSLLGGAGRGGVHKCPNGNVSQDEKLSTNSTTNIIDDDDDESQSDLKLDQLVDYLSKDPAKRPTIREALSCNLFELYRVDNHETSSFDPFRIENLNDLESQFSQLEDYLSELIKNENSGKSQASLKKSCRPPHQILFVNEKLIEFLLKPFMFYSTGVKKLIFPNILIPKEEYLNEQQRVAFNLRRLRASDADDNDDNSHVPKLEPFLDLNKYKALVLPRVLNLFAMHSTQIRIVLLEYFPFYISYVNDKETLKYEILPEVSEISLSHLDRLIRIYLAAHTFNHLFHFVKAIAWFKRSKRRARLADVRVLVHYGEIDWQRNSGRFS
jgi:hypothetical protein